MPIAVASDNFNKGYISDVARDQLPSGYAYRMKDWIPGLDSRLRGRGGWVHTSPNLASVHAGPASLVALGWAPFVGDEHLIAIGNEGSVYQDKNLDGITATFVATAAPANMSHPPFWHPDLKGMVLPVSNSPSRAVGESVAAYTHPAGYTVAALGGSPPAGSVGAAWGDYLLLANGDSANVYVAQNFPNRIWISAVGAPTSWTPGTNFWDSAIPDIVALVPVRAGILVFGYQQTSLISGDVPPAGGNWSEQIVFQDQGCWDVRSIAKYEDIVFFANNTGVYSTDGVTLNDITLACGVKTRWQQLVKGAAFAWSPVAGIFRNYLIISVLDNNGNLKTCHVFDFLNHDAFEFTNVKPSMFAHLSASKGTGVITDGEERLFMAQPSSAFVCGLHTCWTTPDTMVDGDNSNVLPQLETPFYKGGRPGKKLFRSMRATYDVRAAGSTPTLSVDYALTPSGAYVNAGSLPTTTDESRAKVDIRQRGTGIGLRLTQVGKSGHTTLGEVELDERALEAMR